MKHLSWLKFAAVAIVAMAGTAKFARADVVIGNFETGVDGWGTDGGDASFNGDPPTYAQSTIGVTLGTQSLAVTQNTTSGAGSPFFDPAASENILPVAGGVTGLSTSTQLTYDETFLSTELFQTHDPSDPNSPGFAQTNELIFSLFGTGASLGTSTLNLHLQKTITQGQMTDSVNTGANRGAWNGTDHTSHVSWNLLTFTTTDPSGVLSGTVTVWQLMAAHPDIAWNAKFQLPLGSGDNTANGNGFGTFFFDNVVIAGATTPEPASLGLLALGSLLGLRRRRK